MEVLASVPGSFPARVARRLSRPWLALTAIVAGLHGAFGQIGPEYQLKGVLLYNLTQFVEWPAETFPNAEDPIRIGILGYDPFGKVLDKIVAGETVNHRRITVERYQTVEDVRNCQLLFISASEQNRWPHIFSELKGKPILTVADFNGFSQTGGMIQFFINSENKIRLNINLDSVKANGLNLSSKLLRVAEVVSSEGS